jgi:hypothetical protein
MAVGEPLFAKVRAIGAARAAAEAAGAAAGDGGGVRAPGGEAGTAQQPSAAG